MPAFGVQRQREKPNREDEDHESKDKASVPASSESEEDDKVIREGSEFQVSDGIFNAGPKAQDSITQSTPDVGVSAESLALTESSPEGVRSDLIATIGKAMEDPLPEGSEGELVELTGGPKYKDQQ